MKSFFNLLNKRAGGGVLSIVLLIFLLAGCSNASGGDSSDNNTSDVPYNLSVRTAYATWVEINFCTVDEMKALSYYGYELYKGNENEPVTESIMNDDETDFYKGVYGNAYNSATPLEPDTEYTIKVTYHTSDYKTIKKELKFKTKPYDFSDYTLEYDDIYRGVRIKSEEVLIGQTEVYRSDKVDGEYEKIDIEKKSTNSIDFLDRNNLQPNKTYYYKFIVTKYNSNTTNYDVLYESTEAKYITLGNLAPKPVDKDSIKIHRGITRVKFEWDAAANATKYKVSVKPYSIYSSNPNLVEAEVTEPVYEFNALEYIEDFVINTSSYTLRIIAQNDVGESNYIEYTFKIGDISVTEVSVTAGQKEAVYRIKTNFDYVAPDCTVEYLLSSEFLKDKVSDDVLLAPVSSTPEITRKDLQIYTEYSASKAGYVFARIKYKDKDENDVILLSNYKKADPFTTAEFDAVTDFEVLSKTRTSITYKFTPLTSEQEDGQDVTYYVMANSMSPKKITNPKASSQTLDKLSAGTNYSIKIIVTNKYVGGSSDFKNYTNFAETEAATDSGLSKPTNIIVTEEAGSEDTKTLLKVKWDRIAEDLDSEDPDDDIAYEVEYKILNKSSFRKFTHKVGNDDVNAYTDTNQASMEVNAGNRYIVRVLAYYVNEPECKEYSDTVEKQLNKYDDRSLVTALTYPKAVGNHAAGDVIDFTDPNVWEGGTFVPRSTQTTGYNIGMTQFMGEATNERFKLPENNPAYFAFKISFDNEQNPEDWGINSTYKPRLIFLDDEAFSLGTNITSYGRFGRIFIVKPDTNGSFVKIFGEEQSIFADVNMPWFNIENGKPVSPVGAASAGLPVDEDWIYNNSVYIGVKQSNAGDLGFSYFY